MCSIQFFRINDSKTALSVVAAEDPPHVKVLLFLGKMRKLIKLIEGNEPEIKGALCMLKYLKFYKLFGFPDSFDLNLDSILRLLLRDRFSIANNSSSTSDSSKKKRSSTSRKSLAKLSPWFCAKIYVILFVVRALKVYVHQEEE